MCILLEAGDKTIGFNLLHLEHLDTCGNTVMDGLDVFLFIRWFL
jgi:hypothetical protein